MAFKSEVWGRRAITAGDASKGSPCSRELTSGHEVARRLRNEDEKAKEERNVLSVDDVKPVDPISQVVKAERDEDSEASVEGRDQIREESPTRRRRILSEKQERCVGGHGKSDSEKHQVSNQKGLIVPKLNSQVDGDVEDETSENDGLASDNVGESREDGSAHQEASEEVGPLKRDAGVRRTGELEVDNPVHKSSVSVVKVVEVGGLL